ncbi:MAG: TonB-dependent receptor [Chitinophagaceae bacterium]
MKQLLTALLLSFIALTASAQNQNKVTGTVKGKVLDTLNKLPLPSATVTVIDKTDSSNIAFAVTDKQGLFELKNIPQGSYIVGVSFVGYAELIKKVSISPGHTEIDLGDVLLKTDTSMLASVTVTQPPIKIDKDTVEFRASAFPTKPNATVEDLLKKLPGVEVDKDGNVTAQGENITKVYVDGKEFFSNDPKLATKNLTAELVESIQVFDDMSDQAKFTRIDDGSRQRTINIKLKKDKKKGYFGRVVGGGGTEGRYEGSLSANRFNSKTQLSLIAGANNINRPGFTSSDLVSSIGGMSALSGGNGGGGGGNRGGGGGGGGRGGGGGGGGGSSAANGNTQTWSAGVNYRDTWSPKLEFAGNYFISNTNTITRSDSYTQKIFPSDSVAYTDEISYSKNTNLSQRFGGRLEYTIDTMNSLLFTPTFSVQHATSLNYDSLVTRATSPATDYTAIEGNSARSNTRDGWNFGNNTLFRHRFKKAGRTFTVGWNTAVNSSNAEGFNTSPYTFFNKDGSLNYIQDRRQRYDQETYSFNNTISTSVTEMFGTNKILELNYAYTNNRSTSDRKTYDYDAASGEYDSINKPLTNYFENKFISSRIGTNFRVKNVKYDFQLGGAVQVASLENMSHRAQFGKDSLMKQTYTNFFPNASFNYNLGTRKSLRFNYRGSTRAPSISQLQDVQDVSNPLNIRTGNPDLKQEFTNTVNFSYNTINLSNFLYLNSTIAATLTSNKIVNSTDSLQQGILLTRPVNVNGAFNLSFSGTIGIPLKKVATGKRSPMGLNLTTSLRYNRDVSVLYSQTNYNYTRTLNERVNFNYNVQDKFDIGANANFSYNDASYSVQSSQNYKYFSHSYSLDVTYIFFSRLSLSSDFDYLINTGRSSGYNQAIPLWNANISLLMFKKKNGELKAGVADILNQNKSITRTVSEFTIQDTHTQVLQRFFMVSFLYNFNRFGDKRGPGQGRPPGGFERGGRPPGGAGGGMRGSGGTGGRRN